MGAFSLVMSPLSLLTGLQLYGSDFENENFDFQGFMRLAYVQIRPQLVRLQDIGMKMYLG